MARLGTHTAYGSYVNKYVSHHYDAYDCSTVKHFQNKNRQRSKIFKGSYVMAVVFNLIGSICMTYLEQLIDIIRLFALFHILFNFFFVTS